MLCVDPGAAPTGPSPPALGGGARHAWRFDEPFEGTRAPAPVSDRVRAYFAGDVHALDEVAVDPDGTPFQRRIWAALRDIPPGETRTYGELARQLGTHPRAVGAASGRNPVCLAIPGHRVIASDAKLCGYAWGEERRRWSL